MSNDLQVKTSDSSKLWIDFKILYLVLHKLQDIFIILLLKNSN
jgi:hypothetical protein